MLFSSTAQQHVTTSTHTMLMFYVTAAKLHHQVPRQGGHVITQRKPSLDRDKGLDLLAIYNPLLGIHKNLSVM